MMQNKLTKYIDIQFYRNQLLTPSQMLRKASYLNNIEIPVTRAGSSRYPPIND